MTHAVTLTLKPNRALHTETGIIFESLDVFKARRTFRFFMNRLNKAVYGTSGARYGKRLFVIPVLEGQATGKHLHYHCAFGNFREVIDDLQINTLIKSAWIKTEFGAEQMVIKPIISADWFSYMGKEVALQDKDVVDYDNVTLPSTTTLLA
jgi:hypothetical protein